jgi:flavin reductase (DIM6/NTAB) family NADH-FMN oxidoreductase RutF
MLASSVDGPRPVSAVGFRDALAHLAAPIAVVTARYAGRAWGLTASSVTAMSLDPPLVSVSLDRAGGCRDALVAADEFVVNVLTDGDSDIATRFATPGIDRFASGGMAHFPGTDLPVVVSAGACYRCARCAVLPVGDHDLLIGTLIGAQVRPDRTALLWYRRAYHAPHGLAR